VIAPHYMAAYPLNHTYSHVPGQYTYLSRGSGESHQLFLKS